MPKPNIPEQQEKKETADEAHKRKSLLFSTALMSLTAKNLDFSLQQKEFLHDPKNQISKEKFDDKKPNSSQLVRNKMP